jgi:hypothetical protein
MVLKYSLSEEPLIYPLLCLAPQLNTSFKRMNTIKMTVYFMCFQQLLLRQHILTDLDDFWVLYHHRE